MTKAIVCIVNGGGCAAQAGAHPLFSASRNEKIARMHTDEGRMQCACAELAYLVIETLLNRTPAPYEYRENGKPFYKEAGKGFLSFSHVRSAGACAFANEPLGLDVEDAGRDLRRITRRLLSQTEIARGENDFVKAWCVKESFVKLTGEGLSRPFPSLTMENNRILDEEEGREEACFRTGKCGELLWAVSLFGEFEIKVHAFTYQEALRIIGA